MHFGTPAFIFVSCVFFFFFLAVKSMITLTQLMFPLTNCDMSWLSLMAPVCDLCVAMPLSGVLSSTRPLSSTQRIDRTAVNLTYFPSKRLCVCDGVVWVYGSICTYTSGAVALVAH